MRGELKKNLLSLEKPLKFASKDNFSNLDRMADLEGTVRNLCTKVLTSDPPEEIKTQITALRDSFSDFKRLTHSEKAKRILSAIAVVRRIIPDLAQLSELDILPRSRAPRSHLEKKTFPQNRGEGFLESVAQIPGVGTRAANLLAKRSVRTVYDILFYCPRKYDDRRKIVGISDAVPEEFCTVRGTVASVADIRNRRRRFFQVVISDGTDRLKLTWFNYNPSYLRGIFKKGRSSR